MPKQPMHSCSELQTEEAAYLEMGDEAFKVMKLHQLGRACLHDRERNSQHRMPIVLCEHDVYDPAGK